MSMLEGAPWLLAHKSMLKVNQPKKVSLYGKDYVLWMDRKGNIQALPNACPHMGAMLSEGWCEKREDGESVVVCPFHALGFNSEGCTIMPGSRKKTKPQLTPLELIIHDDFIWSYGEKEPKVPITHVLNKIASRYEYIGHTADMSIETDLLSMLLNMHDYNHQNGTHSPLFKVKGVNFKEFRDGGHHSHAIYDLPTRSITWKDFWQNPSVLMVPKTVHVHLENLFPYCLVFYTNTIMGKIAQIHLFIPESPTHTRTFVLLYAIPRHPILKILSGKFLEFAKVITQQDADILGKIYPNSPQKMKLNNEVGMDWVKRNFKNWPNIVKPQLSRPALGQYSSVLSLNESCLEAERNMIHVLLTYPNKAAKVLAANQQLLNPGFVQMMKQVATQMAASESQEAADFLRELAAQLKEEVTEVTVLAQLEKANEHYLEAEHNLSAYY